MYRMGGCSYLVQSHGIPEDVIDNTVRAAKRYFSLPEATKMEVSFYVCPRIGFCYFIVIVIY